MIENDLHKLIEKRAYEIWEYRMQHGMPYIFDRLHNLREINDVEDWLEAEQEIGHAKNFYKKFNLGGEKDDRKD